MTPSAEWTVVTATARGSAHDDETDNQDRVGWTVVPTEHDDVVITALSDGHGGSRYVRSALGAQFAVETALQVLGTTTAADSGTPLSDVLRRSIPEVTAAWRARCLQHAADHPFTAAERRRCGTDPDQQPIVSYGATLLLAVVRGSWIAIAQLGDGDVLASVDAGTVHAPVPDDARLIGGATTSLCLDGAEEDFRYAEYDPGRDCRLLVLATDGYGNAFASPDWRGDVVTDIASLWQELGPEEVGHRLPAWLQESAEVGGDDVTLAVLARSPSSAASRPVTVDPGRTLPAPPPATRPAPEVPAATTDGGTTPSVRTGSGAHLASARPPRRRRHLTILVVAALALGLVAWWALRSSRGASPPPASDPPTGSSAAALPTAAAMTAPRPAQVTDHPDYPTTTASRETETPR